MTKSTNRRERQDAVFYQAVKSMPCDFRIENINDYPQICQRCFMSKLKQLKREKGNHETV